MSKVCEQITSLSDDVWATACRIRTNKASKKEIVKSKRSAVKLKKALETYQVNNNSELSDSTVWFAFQVIEALDDLTGNSLT